MFLITFLLHFFRIYPEWITEEILFINICILNYSNKYNIITIWFEALESIQIKIRNITIEERSVTTLQRCFICSHFNLYSTQHLNITACKKQTRIEYYI